MTVNRSSGEVVRVVGDSLAYALVKGGRTFSFTPSLVENYRGRSFTELQINEGTRVNVDWHSSSGIVEGVSTLPESSASRPPVNADDMIRGATKIGSTVLDDLVRGAETSLRGHRTDHAARGKQFELLPESIARRPATVLRALPPATRRFGRLVDTANLEPADVLLSREVTEDRISALIAGVQRDGGYHTDDARWTHAAMYLGDGANVVEADFDSVLGGGSVRLTSLDEYCQGKHSLRFRRSKYLLGNEHTRERWLICIRAMSRLGKPYDFYEAALMWFSVVLGRGFFRSEKRRPTSAAVVCSTLIADAFNEATRRCLGEVSGVCVPAWLSVSDEFNDIAVEWVTIQ
jgi:hypothetical protein